MNIVGVTSVLALAAFAIAMLTLAAVREREARRLAAK